MKQYLALLALVTMTAGCIAEAQDELDAQDETGEEIDTENAAYTIGGDFLDHLDGYNTSRWLKANWANGDFMFNCGWRPDHVYHSGGLMNLKLSTADSHGKPYSAGEYQTTALYTYGKAETRMKTVKRSGIVTSFFTYTGPSDGNPWDEIDIEILGKDTTKVQFNYFKNGVGKHEVVKSLGFDSSTGFHNYAIIWMANKIVFKVDGAVFHTYYGDPSTLPSKPMHIMMNMWNATGVDGWTGPFSYPGYELTASYDWAQYFKNGTY